VSQTQAEKQVKEEKPREFKTVAVCGTAESLAYAPFKDKNIDIWGVATMVGHKPVTRADRLFEMHTPDRWMNRKDAINEFVDKTGCDVYMHDVTPEIKNSKKFPLEWLDKHFRRYYTNSLSYQIALAILEGYGNMQLYGVHFATNSEYEYERPSLEYYLGIAEAKGINVYVPSGCELLKAKRLYGYDNAEMVHVIRERVKGMEQRKQQAQEQLENARDVVNQYVGALDFAEYVKKLVL
jgi:hypothetical protein